MERYMPWPKPIDPDYSRCEGCGLPWLHDLGNRAHAATCEVYQRQARKLDRLGHEADPLERREQMAERMQYGSGALRAREDPGFVPGVDRDWGGSGSGE